MKLFNCLFITMSLLVSAVFPIIQIYNEPAINHAHISEINSAQNRTWTAGHNDFLLNKTVGDISDICGTVLDSNEYFDIDRIKKYDSYDTIPKHFDSRDKWEKFIHPIRNQERCGSCWAFSAAEVLSDRFTIATSGSVDIVLSPEDLVSCDTKDMGCMGGQLFSAWQYMVKTGLVSEKCFPYNSGEGKTSSCITTCLNSESFNKSKHKAKNYYTLKTVEDIQVDIMKNGPVQAAFRVYKSFMAYKTGVYQRNWWSIWDRMLGGHAVKIIGWGTVQEKNKSIDYWTVANSWSTTWGEDGYFRIVRGKDECGIESTVYAGLPLLE